LSEDRLPQPVDLLHSSLIAYQLALRDILGSGWATFVHPVLENFTKLNEAIGINLEKGGNLDQAFQNFSNIIQSAGLVRELRFERLGKQKYYVHVEGCVWAPQVHKKLNPKDLTCPFALMAMSIFQNSSHKKVKLTTSEYFPEGTKTLIETI